MTPLAERLRSATRDSHQRLDRQPLLRPLLDGPLDASGYGAALAALHGPLGCLEQALAACPDVPAVAAYQPRLGLLEQDLAVLERAPWPYRGNALVVSDRAGLIGTRYVLEGARLGDRLIARRLQQHAPQLPCRFFQQGGADGWPDDWALLLTSLPEREHQAACAAALAAFATFIDHFERIMPVDDQGERP